MAKFFIRLIMFSMVTGSAMASALASTYKQINVATRLGELQHRAEAICEVADLRDNNCRVRSFKIENRGPRDLFIMSVREILMFDRFVQFASAFRLNEGDTQSFAHQVIDAAQVDLSSTAGRNASQAYLAQLDRNVMGDSTVQVYGGTIEGLLSLDQIYIAVVDSQNNEVIILQAGYAE